MQAKAGIGRVTGEVDMRDMAPVTLGEILLGDFVKPLGITRYRLAKALKVPASRIHEIAHGKRPITADLALRLARFLGTDAQSWVNLQAHFDLEKARAEFAEGVNIEVSPTPPEGGCHHGRRILEVFCRDWVAC